MQARNILMQEFKDVLDIADEQCIDIELATALHSTIGHKGDPLWMVLVGAPGIGKTQLGWQPFQQCTDMIHNLGGLTTKTFHTGLSKGRDLLPQLNGKLVLLQDMSSIFNTREDTSREIFNQLRQIYDGKLTTNWGSEKSTVSHGSRFDLIGCTTKTLFNNMRALDGGLGERMIPIYLRHDRRGMMYQVSKNVGRESIVNEHLQQATKKFLSHTNALTPYFDTINIPPYFLKVIQGNARFSLKLRTVVSHDYRHEIIDDPELEGSGRFLNALITLVKSLACVYEHHEITDYEMKIVRRLCYDQVPRGRMVLIELMQRQDRWSIDDLVDLIHLPDYLIKRRLKEMWVLKLLAEEKDHGTVYYSENMLLYGDLWHTRILEGGLVTPEVLTEDIPAVVMQQTDES